MTDHQEGATSAVADSNDPALTREKGTHLRSNNGKLLTLIGCNIVGGGLAARSSATPSCWCTCSFCIRLCCGITRYAVPLGQKIPQRHSTGIESCPAFLAGGGRGATDIVVNGAEVEAEWPTSGRSWKSAVSRRPCRHWGRGGMGGCQRQRRDQPHRGGLPRATVLPGCPHLPHPLAPPPKLPEKRANDNGKEDCFEYLLWQ